jgi:hypothetical protein
MLSHGPARVARLRAINAPHARHLRISIDAPRGQAVTFARMSSLFKLPTSTNACQASES